MFAAGVNLGNEVLNVKPSLNNMLCCHTFMGEDAGGGLQIAWRFFTNPAAAVEEPPAPALPQVLHPIDLDRVVAYYV